MEYSSTKSNRSLRSIQLDEIEPQETHENSIIIEEKENDDSTKYSDPKKQNLVLPELKQNTPKINKKAMKKFLQNQPTYYYSLQLQRSKLGTMSTTVIKEQVNRIRNS